MQICDVLRQQLGALVSSYDILINCDNTLTTEGERSACIRNGIVLASGGIPPTEFTTTIRYRCAKSLENPQAVAVL